jgi:hypothetical protein
VQHVSALKENPSLRDTLPRFKAALHLGVIWGGGTN